MAKIKFGMMMTDASGKLGGQVFSKNRGGSYVRTKSTPVNRQSSAQMNVRGIFASISSRWSSLSESARESFNGFVGDYSRTDIFGDLRNPSGKALFQRLNQNALISGQAQIDVCVSPESVPFANLKQAELELADTIFILEAEGNLTGAKVVVWATPSLSLGTKFVKNRLRQLVVLDGNNNTGYDIYSAYIARFGVPVVGANVHVGIRVINSNGQASPLEVTKARVLA